MLEGEAPEESSGDGRYSVTDRRLSAVMFTDMVGYTALTQRNEELAYSVLEEQRHLVRQILPKHGGNEIKTIGDAFMVEFLSALEAVRCAVDIQRSIDESNSSNPPDRRLQLRIGIHVGDVEHKGGDIYGDSVNIASRIEPLAQPGGITITQQVYDQIRNKTNLQFEKLGAMSLKNVDIPVEVYAVLLTGGGASLGPSRADKRRLVVLPFANMTPDPNDEYFADGMTEELISTISKVGELSVISRTSAMKYKGAAKSVREIGADLQVGYVLEGSVRKAGMRVRITVQLIEVTEDRHIWAETYDRDFEDVFAIQSDIAQKVAEALKIRLVTRDMKMISREATTSVEAYTLYLKGRYHWNRRTKESLLKAVELFEAATKIDPGFALAYVGIADCYNVLSDHLYIAPEEGVVKAKKAATKAIELDGDLAEAHVSLGGALGLFEWDFMGAEREFRRGIELNPNYATAHQWYSLFLWYLRKLEQAKEEATVALKLDPLSPIIYTDLGDIYTDLGEPDAALGMLRKALELDPDFIPALIGLANAYSLKGSYEEAERTARKLVTLDAGPVGDLILAHTLARSGKREPATEILDRLLLTVGDSYVDSPDFAAVYLALGDREKAFDWLEKGFEVRAAGMLAISVDSRFTEIRSEPRFLGLLRRMGLDQEG